MSAFSTYLFAQPSIIEGAGRLFDFGGFMDDYNFARSAKEKEADELGVRADWRQVGEDLTNAMNEFGRTQAGQATNVK